MPNENSFNPSAVDISSAVITSYDGVTKTDISGNMISSFEISQSMHATSYSGYIQVVDTVGLLDDFPIRGEESLDLEIISYDLQTVVKLKTKIFKVSDIQPTESSNGVMFKLHFVSAVTFEASKRLIIKSYDRSVYAIAKDIFDTCFAKLNKVQYTDITDRRRTLPYKTQRYSLIDEPTRNFFLQPTVGVSKLIIPQLSSSEAMYFVASRGFHPDTPSQTYRFFETLENFYFCTDEYFIKDMLANELINLYYAPAATIDSSSPEEQLNRVEELQIISKNVNTADDIFSGSYRSQVTEVDFVRRKVEYRKFDYEKAKYIDMTGNPRSSKFNHHTKQFREDTFTAENAKRFLVFRDYQRDGDAPSILNNNLNFTEIVQNRISYYHHLNGTQVIANLKGRLDIRPGMIVNLDIKNLSGHSDKAVTNSSLAGRYLVDSTVHGSRAGILHTSLKLVKFDWSTKPPKTQQDGAITDTSTGGISIDAAVNESNRSNGEV